MSTLTTPDAEAVWQIVAAVLDPEVPVVTIEDLGILRAVEVDEAGRVHVVITPTYSGCPAMETITTDVVAALAEAGHTDAVVEMVLGGGRGGEGSEEKGKRKRERGGG
ncbi:MAG: metal-sulfur cluster assembly factor [Nocardioides sp.]